MANSKYIRLSILCACLALVGCREDVDYSRLVVEGWIDDEQHPIVLVHRSYSMNASNMPDSTTLADIIADQMVIFGRVAISDGIDTFVLTGKVDTNYMPPYIYTTVFMRGEAGKTYHIEVLDHGDKASATTTIPTAKPVIDSFSVSYTDGLMYPRMLAYASHLEPGEHYIVMTKTKPRGQYKICPMGVLLAQNTRAEIDVKYYSAGGFDFNFSSSEELQQYDTVYVKLAHVGEVEYRIWDSFVAQSLTQGVFFMETHSNIVTNIINGNGYWCGMSANEYLISLNHYLAIDAN